MDIDYTPMVTKQMRDDIHDMIKHLSMLNDALETLEKKATPVYDKYKQFKNVSVGKSFILRNGRYEKREVINMLGNNVNALNDNTKQYEYVSDYEWVIELD